MRIEVFITGWEQACCGEPFSVGDQVSWQVVAEDPGFVDSAVPVFREERHGQTPPHVPHLEVTGTVVSITGVKYVDIPEPGHSHSFIQTSTVKSSQRVEAVGTADDINFADYRVELDVANDAVLPEYVATVNDETLRADDERRTARRNDTVGVMLTSLADYAERRYGRVARIDRATERHAVTLEPHRDGAAAVYWARSDREDLDGIHVEVGKGSWTFPSAATHVATLASFLDAAANGRVEERVVTPDPETRELQTVVHSEDSETWTATATVEVPASTDGYFIVVGNLWKRVQEGDHVYEPWETPA